MQVGSRSNALHNTLTTVVVLTLALVGVWAQPALARSLATTELGDGSWSWFGDPRAVHANDVTYVGWVDRDGDVKVCAYDHRARSRTTTVLHTALQADDHVNPSLMLRPDGRLAVFYSAHGGDTLYERVADRPGDVSRWGPPASVPVNTPGTRGYTYPNPIELAGERRLYLFWRGGDWQPTYSTRDDGADTWAPARTLISVPGERPYVKYDATGGDRIAVAFTNTHPREDPDVNVYYAENRDGALYRADGTRIGTLGTPISPTEADTVYDGSANAWVWDVAFDQAGRPVIVFADFPATRQHRYLYARFDPGAGWRTHPITVAGGSISLDGREEQYSPGISLDHEDPSVVYLSREVDGVPQVEIWRTPDGGASWTSESVTGADPIANVRPISPRGLTAFNGDLSVLWIHGTYLSYVAYTTSIATVLATGGALPPIADVQASPRSGRAPQAVGFETGASRDPDGRIVSWTWDFGDGETSSAPAPTHVYRSPGRYFPRLTITDDAGLTDSFVAEVVIAEPTAPAVSTGPATRVTATTATLSGLVNPGNQETTYHFEYGLTTQYGQVSETASVGAADLEDHPVSAALTGLEPGAVYHYRLMATNATGTTTGEDATFTAVESPPSAYREALLATTGLKAYWRLGERAGSIAADETGAHPARYRGNVALGQPGALAGDPDTSAAFGGRPTELTATGPELVDHGTLEGWFRWHDGVALMRDDTASSTAGWILAYDSAGQIRYRVAGTTFNTGIPTSRMRDGWHHVAITKDDRDVAWYLDGAQISTGSGAGDTPPAMPWHVMRNGGFDQYAIGQADEIAVYERPLAATEITDHWRLGHGEQAATDARSDTPPEEASSPESSTRATNQPSRARVSRPAQPRSIRAVCLAGPATRRVRVPGVGRVTIRIRTTGPPLRRVVRAELASRRRQITQMTWALDGHQLGTAALLRRRIPLASGLLTRRAAHRLRIVISRRNQTVGITVGFTMRRC